MVGEREGDGREGEGQELHSRAGGNRGWRDMSADQTMRQESRTGMAKKEDGKLAEDRQ